ncbi:FAD-linked oxidoreductase [Coleophoma crateriformis]|uniref:Proline dehydrogenase n=1 Tax=Coleophoma crateriformis TaxID=565419 RepID=A0A3D8RPN2_9HELO|nr:FAD-linked oxidoreductase [Coleophoma crateriformis]
MAGSTNSMKFVRGTKRLRLDSRSISSKSPLRQSTIAADEASSVSSLPLSTAPSVTEPAMSKSSPLSILPLSCVVRSLATTSISSSPVLLGPSLAIMNVLAHTQSPILSPDSNPVLRWFLKKTFYKQFCAGENAAEVKATIDGLKGIGFKGVILGYAKEVVLTDAQKANLASCGQGDAAEKCIQEEIIPWAQGTLETVRLAEPGDFVALKFTGAGQQALFDLSENTGPSTALKDAIDSICTLASKRGVPLLFDAEQDSLQTGIDRWTLDYMRKYNKKGSGKAVVYGTYQAYRKQTPSNLAAHLAVGRQEDFTVGVKLVRGAYLGSDPRHTIHDTKADTDYCYDGIAEALIRGSYNSVLRPAKGESEFPSVNVVLAGHNHTSVRKAQAVRSQQARSGEPRTEMVYAQLQGMADEVSCDLVQSGIANAGDSKVDVPKAYKYLVWGTTGECMKYLLRRAQENRDAVERTREGRIAMAGELMRRMKKSVGLGA